MTLSNFDWTDKYSARWFIMLPAGHEGPYTLDSLIQRQEQGHLSLKVKIWSEGLDHPVELDYACHQLTTSSSEEEIPPLPPLPLEDDIPPIPVMDNLSEEVPEAEVMGGAKKWTSLKKVGLPLVIGITLIILLALIIQSQAKFAISRLSGMSPELHQRIGVDFKFESWNKKIFFKEYVPADLSHIWLVTNGFQTCHVEATFTSVQNKLLSLTDEKISFKTNGILKDHVVDFSSFDFQTGNKIIPGFYEMDVFANQCVWDGVVPQIANWFSVPEKQYVARTKVILFAKGPDEFNRVLDKLIRKKLEIEVKNQDQENLFWLDLQQKFQTLLAITLQIEQLFVDFLEKDPKTFAKNRLQMEVLYTQKFGGFLTKFVTSNEEYFKDLAKSELSNLYQKQSYESLVRLTSKKIGHESMKLIEEFQKQKMSPSKNKIEEFQSKVRKTFASLKEEINLKIIKVTDDRSN